MIIAATRLFIDGAFSGPASLRIERGVIAEILPGIAEQADFRLEGGVLSPGLIDLHNNGAFGVDFATASEAEWQHVVERLAAHGVTSLLPTIITAPLGAIEACAQRAAAAMRRHPAILGLHLEGPFLAPAKRGAHRLEWLLPFSPDDIARVLRLPALRMITLAPERAGAISAIKRFTSAGIVVSLGHTEASAEEMAQAAGAGARLVTHVFNAQSALSHRAPGAPGAALTDPRLYPCLIADGLHVDPLVLKLAFAASQCAVAVSDSILAAGMEEGYEATFGGEPIRLEGGIARRPDGTLAGSAIILDEAVRRLISAGIAPEVALAAATQRPAAALGLTDRGRIAPGCRADLIWWREDFSIARVWTAGQTNSALVPPRDTEAVRTDLAGLDVRPMPEIIGAFLAQEDAAQRALRAVAQDLAALAEAVAARLKTGGRLFYVGAGTSGRLALLDAVECAPTFGVGEEMLVPLLAGGPSAMMQAIEGAEDDAGAAEAALRAHGLKAGDAVIGVAASGRTPFTRSALEFANKAGALTGAIVNNPDTPLAAAAQIAVVIGSGPEVIAGSTRLSAGTTQKVALNTLSSAVMIRLGKTYGPYMVDLRVTNRKLKRRAVRMTAELAGVSPERAEAVLAAAGMQVKIAVLMLRRDVGADEALEILGKAGGNLRLALGEQKPAG